MDSETCENAMSLRQTLASKKSIVIKVGTNVILNDDGSIAGEVMAELVASVATIQRSGRDVVLVSSGAVGLGANRLGLTASAPRPVCAAAGQSLLTSAYHTAFAQHALPMAQILVTSEDFMDEGRAAGLRATIQQLLMLGIVPLLNENDAVSQHATTSPSKRLFHDNDQLAALIAKLLETKLLILLTDVDGLYTLHPNHSDAELIAELRAITEQHLQNAEQSGPRGRGGMKAKLQAIENAMSDPVLIAVIANGRRAGVLNQIMAGDEVGTLIASTAASTTATAQS